MNADCRTIRRIRRGNTIVLVTGILVLLVIIATAFVVRTQAGRVAAGSSVTTNLRDDNARVIAEDVAQELSIALFARPINTAIPTTGVGASNLFGANWPRFAIPASALRLFPDDQDIDGNGRLDFPYNAPPFEVVARTNWPDPLTPNANDGITNFGGLTANLWPGGIGNPGVSHAAGSILAGEYNDLGNPGFNDVRWLRDLEPLRWDTNADGLLDAFSHWRHMAYIARPDNGWRLIYNIADVEASIVTDLNIPVEQWLPFSTTAGSPFASRFDAASGNALYPGQAAFEAQWFNWFNSLDSYQSVYRDPFSVPLNLYSLRSLGLPQEEFYGPGVHAAFPAGSNRWSVSRVLADADGDGYTDSFWFLAPSPVQSGTRTLVAVSIIDNQGMANANVFTHFVRSNTTGIDQRTGGLAPVDSALVGQFSTAVPATVGNFHVGLYDTWENWFSSVPIVNAPPPTASYSLDPTTYWTRHLREVGLVNAAGGALITPNTAQRMDYWRRAASNPLSADHSSWYTPFGLSDELELRMYRGQNYPWILSRYENSTGGAADTVTRSQIDREESSEFLDQLFNRQLVRDLRSKTTLYNGARNDIMPPWLWLWCPHRDFNNNDYTTAGSLDLNNDGAINAADEILFLAGTRKLDLRLPYDSGSGFITLPGEWNGVPGFEFGNNLSAYEFASAVRDRLSAALIDGFDNLPGNRGTYFGNSPNDVDRTLELCAAYAANISQWRDRANTAAGDVTSRETAPLEECVPIAAGPTNPTPVDRFMGLEPQPFIVEAFIGHAYDSIVVPQFDGANQPYTNFGNNVVTEDPDRRSTVIAVQIANPFSRPINLDDLNAQFQVRLFGQEFDLAGLGVLPPATDDRPTTMVLFAAKEDFNGDPDFDTNWQDFLDILQADLTPESVIIRVPTARWDIESRSVYDTGSEPGLEIRRRDMSSTGIMGPWVTIDRIDVPNDDRFRDEVNNMQATAPPVLDPPNVYVIPDPLGGPYPGHDLGPGTLEYNHWVQWVRATRAWGVDVDNDGESDSNERSPRYVFGDYAVATAAGTPVTDPAVDGPTFVYAGNRYKYVAHAPDNPWFTRPYTREDPAIPGQDVVVDTRKPTFFNMNHVALAPPAVGGDPAFPQWSFPDKGWYGQRGPGSPDDPVMQPITPPPPPPQPQAERGYRYPYAFQMLHKDGDFEQVGELLNVFLYGHRLQFSAQGPAGLYVSTVTTFSEYMSQASGGLTGYEDVDHRFRTNRLLLAPVNTGSGIAGAVIGAGDPTALDDPRHAIPDLPAGVRILEAFVCDSYGAEPLVDLNGNGSTLDEAEARTFYNAKGFDGSGTPGLININTAPLEVIRTLPHMFRLVHETGGTGPGTPFFNYAGQPLVTTAPNPSAALPRVAVPESMLQYREKFNGNTTAGGTGLPGGPDFELRQNPRGFATTGQVLLLQQSGQFASGSVVRQTSNTTDTIYNEQWRLDMGVARQPLAVNSVLLPVPFLDTATTDADQLSMRISTDRQGEWDPFATVVGTPRPDSAAGDAEEANMLFAGISNLITTRSDVFTVYLKVRTFRQNTSVNPPRWDATNREYIVDDSRYVLLVDRSGVNSPADKPRILYFEKLPN